MYIYLHIQNTEVLVESSLLPISAMLYSILAFFGNWIDFNFESSLDHRRLCRVKNMLAIYVPKIPQAGLTPTTPVISTDICAVKMSTGRKSLTNLRSEMIFLQGKPVFYIFLPSTPPY